MGLSASQARLLTITSRKSDCEFQSMRYSHEKIALSRNLTDVSNEYQNALNQTKLVYDFYGTNDRSTLLSYGLMMEPSVMNNYLPMLTTNSAGKVVLDSRLAAAARAAGIPNEGLGTLPSTSVRNKFLAGLEGQRVITPLQRQNYEAIDYNQSVGQGNIDPITQNVNTKVTYDQLLDIFSNNDEYKFNMTGAVGTSVTVNAGSGQEHCDGDYKLYDSNKNEVTAMSTLTLADLLAEGSNYTYWGRVRYEKGNEEIKERNKGHIEYGVINAISNSTIWKQMVGMFESALGVDDPAIKAALQYAKDETENLYSATKVNSTADGLYQGIGGRDEQHTWLGDWGAWVRWINNRSDERTAKDTVINSANKYLGYYIQTTRSIYGGDGVDVAYKKARSYEAAAINVSSVAKAFLTYFAEFMNGFEDNSVYVDDTAMNIQDYTTLKNKQATDNGQTRAIGNCKFVNSKTPITFAIVEDTSVNTGEALLSSFYDAMFNQICQRGWVENDKVRDTEYLQEMYKNGMLFLTTCTDDGFYWQGNYAANSMIKEVTDEDAIARAEAKYNTEKQKINHKEEIIDLKMKNLDTEISSLSTEYDTIKSLISKNIERGFKRYDA